MTQKKFGVGVGTFHGYDPATGELIMESRTMMDNTLTAKVSNKEVRAGKGNQLLYTYYFSGDLEVSLSEAQFNLGFIAATMGADVNLGDNVWTEESVTLGTGGTGAVSYLPLQSPDITGSAIYGWATDATGATTKVTFTGQNFTLLNGVAGTSVCVRYFRNDINTQTVTIPSNIIPKIIRAVIDVEEATPDEASGIYGILQVEIPRLQLDGSLTLGFKSTDVATTPLKGKALAFTPVSGGCANTSQYAIIREIPNNSNWYDNVLYLASTKDGIALNSTTTTSQLSILAITSDSKSFVVPNTELTFTSATPATATVSSSGLITRVAAGTDIITISITAKPAITTNVDVTVS